MKRHGCSVPAIQGHFNNSVQLLDLKETYISTLFNIYKLIHRIHSVML